MATADRKFRDTNHFKWVKSKGMKRSELVRVNVLTKRVARQKDSDSRAL